MKILRAVVFGIVGLLIGFSFANAAVSGYFVRWELASIPSEKIDALFDVEEEMSGPRSATKYTKPCDYTKPEFSFLSNSPKFIEDCMQEYEQYPEGAGRWAYVLDNNGNVWRWEHTSYYDGPINNMICFPGLGLLLGIIIGFTVNSARKTEPVSGKQL